MLTIHVPSSKLWDSKNECFIDIKSFKLTIEHSLVSISKWESIWHIPFISDDQKTQEQITSYTKCMTISQNISDESYLALTTKNYDDITSYIKNSMTATWFNEPKKNGPSTYRKKEVITSELIYYWMIALEIPMDCQKWHLNRLLTLIKVCTEKSKTANNKKTNKRATLQNNAAINAARRKKSGSSG